MGMFACKQQETNPISVLISHYLLSTYSFRFLFLILVFSFGNGKEHKCNGRSIPSVESLFYSFNSKLLLFLKEDCVSKEWNFPDNV